MPTDEFTTPPTIELQGTGGNIFMVMRIAGDYLRSQECPDEYIETMLNAVLHRAATSRPCASSPSTRGSPSPIVDIAIST